VNLEQVRVILEEAAKLTNHRQFVVPPEPAAALARLRRIVGNT